MTEKHSKSRQQAEIAFGKTQSQFFARSPAVEEHDFLIQARQEKTQRLREARLAMASENVQQATASLITKRAKKV